MHVLADILRKPTGHNAFKSMWHNLETVLSYFVPQTPLFTILCSTWVGRAPYHSRADGGVKPVDKNYVYSSAVKYPASITFICQSSLTTKLVGPPDQFHIKEMVYIKWETTVDTNWYVPCSWTYSCNSIRKQAVLNSSFSFWSGLTDDSYVIKSDKKWKKNYDIWW